MAIVTTAFGPFLPAGGDVQNVVADFHETVLGAASPELDSVEIHSDYAVVQWHAEPSGDVKTAVVPWSNIKSISQVVTG